MKTTLKNIFLTVVLILAGCMPDKFDDTISSWPLQIQLVSNNASIDLNETEVVLTNVTSGIKSSAYSNNLGQADFKNVIKGEYIISAQKLQSNGSKNLIIGGLKNNFIVTADINKTNLNLKAFEQTDLLIKEIFYTSTRTPEGIGYLSDQFIEIYNNTNSTIYTDGLCIGVLRGSSGQSNTSPSVFKSDTLNLYLESAWMIPGNGHENALGAYKSLVIAQDAMNHQSDSLGNINSIDLSDADWETYQVNNNEQIDIDYNGTKNLVKVHDYTSGNAHDWIFQPHGVSIVLFKIEDEKEMRELQIPNNTKLQTVKTIPTSWVIDGVETLDKPSSYSYKKLPISIDNSFAFCNSIFNKESCRRKFITTASGINILLDTNSSYIDFEIIPSPTPGTFTR